MIKFIIRENSKMYGKKSGSRVKTLKITALQFRSSRRHGFSSHSVGDGLCTLSSAAAAAIKTSTVAVRILCTCPDCLPDFPPGCPARTALASRTAWYCLEK